MNKKISKISLIILLFVIIIGAIIGAVGLTRDLASRSQTNASNGDLVTGLNGTNCTFDVTITGDNTCRLDKIHTTNPSIALPGSVTIGGVDYAITTMLDGDGTSIDVGYEILNTVTSVDLSACTQLTNLGAFSFWNCKKMTQILLPNSITRIGNRSLSWASISTITLPSNLQRIEGLAFSDCNFLTSVHIPANVNYIHVEPFNYCLALQNITVDTNNQYFTAENGVLYNKAKTILLKYPSCKTETTFAVPNTVTTIYNYSFDCCKYLTSVNIPSSVTYVGGNAFTATDILDGSLQSISVDSANTTYIADSDGVLYTKDYKQLVAYPCNSSITSYTINSATTSIAGRSFGGARNLVTLNLSNVTVASGFMMRNAKALVTVIASSQLRTIDNLAFSGCTNLQNFNFEDTQITLIGNDAFRDAKLTNINLPNTLTTIGTYAFYNCASLTSVTLPTSLTSLGNSAFPNCTGLTTINYNATNCADLSSENNAFFKAGQYGTGITVNIGANVTKIPAHLFNSSTSPKIKTLNFDSNSQCTSIGTYAFAGLTDLTSIVLPQSINTIWDFAFYNCSALTSADFSACSNLTALNYSVLRNCTSLTNVVLNNNVQTIGINAFNGDKALTSVTNVAGVTTISDGAFVDCYGLTNIAFPALVDMGNYAFNNCTGLQSITFSSGLRSMGIHAFNNCVALTSITLPEGITSIGEYTFIGCTSLNNVNMASAVVSIDQYAFAHCTSLPSIALPESLLTIGEYAFYECRGLTSITLPENLKTMGNYAFYNCRNVTELNFNCTNMNNLASDNYVFYDLGVNTAGTTINVGDNVRKIPSFLCYPENGSTVRTKIIALNFGENSTCTAINEKAFCNTHWIKSLDLPDSLQGLGAQCFYYNDFKRVRLGKNLNTYHYSFVTTYSLEYIEVDEENPNFCSEDGVLYSKDMTTLYLYPQNKAGSTFTIPSTVTTLFNYAFEHNRNLTTINIPDSVTKISSFAFWATNIRESVISNYVTSFDTSLAYADCHYLTRVVFSDHVTSIKNTTFFRNYELSEIIITNDIKNMTFGGSTFNGGIPEKTIKYYFNSAESLERAKSIYNAKTTDFFFTDSTFSNFYVLEVDDTQFVSQNDLLGSVIVKSKDINGVVYKNLCDITAYAIAKAGSSFMYWQTNTGTKIYANPLQVTASSDITSYTAVFGYAMDNNSICVVTVGELSSNTITNNSVCGQVQMLGYSNSSDLAGMLFMATANVGYKFAYFATIDLTTGAIEILSTKDSDNTYPTSEYLSTERILHKVVYACFVKNS